MSFTLEIMMVNETIKCKRKDEKEMQFEENKMLGRKLRGECYLKFTLKHSNERGVEE